MTFFCVNVAKVDDFSKDELDKFCTKHLSAVIYNFMETLMASIGHFLINATQFTDRVSRVSFEAGANYKQRSLFEIRTAFVSACNYCDRKSASTFSWIFIIIGENRQTGDDIWFPEFLQHNLCGISNGRGNRRQFKQILWKYCSYFVVAKVAIWIFITKNLLKSE